MFLGDLRADKFASICSMQRPGGPAPITWSLPRFHRNAETTICHFAPSCAAVWPRDWLDLDHLTFSIARSRRRERRPCAHQLRSPSAISAAPKTRSSNAACSSHAIIGIRIDLAEVGEPLRSERLVVARPIRRRALRRRGRGLRRCCGALVSRVRFGRHGAGRRVQGQKVCARLAGGDLDRNQMVEDDHRPNSSRAQRDKHDHTQRLMSVFLS